MNNKIKLFGGLAVILNMMSCSGNKLSDEAQFKLNANSVSPKTFLTLSREEQQTIIAQNQSSCVMPMLFPLNDENNLGQYSRDSSACIKVCRLGVVVLTASDGKTYPETTQLVVGVENLQKYAEQVDADGVEDLIGDCSTPQPCQPIPIEPQSLQQGTPINPIAPIEHPIYCIPPEGSSTPPSLIGPPAAVEGSSGN